MHVKKISTWFHKPVFQFTVMGIAIFILAGCQPAEVEPTPTATEPVPQATPTVEPSPTAPEATPTEEILPTPTEHDANNDDDEPEIRSISMLDFTYNPRELTIPVGTTVVWRNTGALPHTATADDGAFNSGILEGGGSFEFTFTEAGEYPYYCTIHGGPGGTGMSGTIIVTDE
jgi:plastocyanin